MRHYARGRLCAIRSTHRCSASLQSDSFCAWKEILNAQCQVHCDTATVQSAAHIVSGSPLTCAALLVASLSNSSTLTSPRTVCCRCATVCSKATTKLALCHSAGQLEWTKLSSLECLLCAFALLHTSSHSAPLCLLPACYLHASGCHPHCSRWWQTIEVQPATAPSILTAV